MAIRYDKVFNREIQRIVKNYNARIKALNGLEKSLAPDLVTVTELKQDYNKRSDLKRRLKELELFKKSTLQTTSIGEEEVTLYNLMLEKRRITATKTNLTREINQLSKSDSQEILQGSYLKNLKYRRKALNINLKQASKRQLSRIYKIVEMDENQALRNQRAYNNVFQMIYKTAYQQGLTPDEVEQLISMLKGLSPSEVADLMIVNSAFKDFLYKYSYLEEGGSEQAGRAAMNLLEHLKESLVFS